MAFNPAQPTYIPASVVQMPQAQQQQSGGGKPGLLANLAGGVGQGLSSGSWDWSNFLGGLAQGQGANFGNPAQDQSKPKATGGSEQEEETKPVKNKPPEDELASQMMTPGLGIPLQLNPNGGPVQQPQQGAPPPEVMAAQFFSDPNKWYGQT